MLRRVTGRVALVVVMVGAVAQAGVHHLDIGGAMDELFIGDGWYPVEGPYDQFSRIWRDTRCRWASQGATVDVPVFPGVTNTFRLRAEVPGDANQRLLCALDREQVARLAVADDLLYVFTVPAAVIGDRTWMTLALSTEDTFDVNPNDSRNLRAVVDWIEIEADAPARSFVQERLADRGLRIEAIPRESVPSSWRYRYDPNDTGGTFVVNRFDLIDYDDSAWDRVAADYQPALRRGEVAWFRAWLHADQRIDQVREEFTLPGGGFEDEGSRQVWVNGVKLAGGDSAASLEQQATGALARGTNLVVVKVMQGPLPRPRGDNLIAPPAYQGSWSPDGVTFELEELVLQEPTSATSALTVTLVSPSGVHVGRAIAGVSPLSGDRRGVKLDAAWPLNEYGEHRLVIESDRGSRQSFPVHFLGIHFFHWGWYTGTDGTIWRGFQPCSNDYLDQLFDKIGDWGRPHHSISWGGAILAPGTGFHRTKKVNYIDKFRTAFAEGQLQLVGMPFPPRNICTEFGESLLRSMRRSQNLYRAQLNADPTYFMGHDANMIPQVTQVMRLCGYDAYVIAENWWGQGRSLPNSRDGFLQGPDGSRVRVLDSWYHGIPATVAARRAVQQGKPAVLCNDEFACLDRTVFLERKDLDALMAEGIFLQPVDLDTYRHITRAFASQCTYTGDEALCYKGWTGGGEGEFEYEKINRRLETHLVALENLSAMARWLGETVDQAGIDTWWDKSMRAHECHLHWVNGHPHIARELEQGNAWVSKLLRQTAEAIARHVGGAVVGTETGSITVFNPLGFVRQGLVPIESDIRVTVAEDPYGTRYPIQRDPELDRRYWASLPDLPSCGYRQYKLIDEPPGPARPQATVRGDRATMANQQVRVELDAAGRILAMTDQASPYRWEGPIHTLYAARPAGVKPDAPLSRPNDPLNLDYYGGVKATAEPRIVADGAVMSIVECHTVLADYPQVSVTWRFTLAAGERQVRVRMTMKCAEPTVIAVPGTRGPHEGTYVPGLFVGFPMASDVRPMADMAYGLTDGVLSSTNHETFLKIPFRNGTFNALSLAGPADGTFAILTRGLPDFFVIREPSSYLGMSLGQGPEGMPYHDTYVHEYAIHLGDRIERDTAPQQAFLAARSFLVDPIAVSTPGQSSGKLPTGEASLVTLDEPNVCIPGIQFKDEGLRVRVLNLGSSPLRARLTGLIRPAGAKVVPAGKLDRDAVILGPQALREMIWTTPVHPADRPE